MAVQEYLDDSTSACHDVLDIHVGDCDRSSHLATDACTKLHDLGRAERRAAPKAARIPGATKGPFVALGDRPM